MGEEEGGFEAGGEVVVVVVAAVAVFSLVGRGVRALDKGIEVFICYIRYVRAEICEGAAESC